jgi:phosphoglycolate phosphatase-like HAD superfamily hydrolase
VEREVDTKIHVYSQAHQIAPGAQQISVDWPLSRTGLDNNVNGHLARVILKDSSGRIIAEKETLFDVVDNWWKVMRLAALGGSIAAKPGKSDTDIHGTVSALRNWGFNTFELFHYAPPWVLNPPSDSWEDIDHAGRFIGRDRVVEWGNALHAQGMKYLAYNETGAIQGPTEWQVFLNGSVWRAYYGDKRYFTPNLNFLSQRWANENIDAINAFDFDGILMDSAYQTGHWTTQDGRDNNGDRMPQYPSSGEFMHDWLGPAKTNVRAVKDTFAYVSQNAFPLVYYSLSEPLDNVYNKVLATANSPDVWPYNNDVDVWSIEWDSVNTPRENYPQEYDRMATTFAALAEVTGKQVLQWGFLTSANRDGIAYIRPKLATYYAARLKVHDHQTFYEGLVSAYEDEADSLQYAQYLRFKARYSYYLDHPDMEWIQQPENSYFTLSASKDLFWNRTVYHRLDEGKHEYIINVLNLPSNGTIEGQTGIPPTAVSVKLGINKSIGDYEVFCLDADDATLVPINVSTSSEDGTYRYYSLPPVRSWQVLVLKEK